MTVEEKELLKSYLTHLNILGEDGSYPDFEAWHQEIRYVQGPSAPRTLEQATQLRYKDVDVLETARVFNRLDQKSQPR